MLDAVAAELDEIGIDRELLLDRLGRDVGRRLARSIERGRRPAGQVARTAEKA
jgi:hypothetical protein